MKKITIVLLALCIALPLFAGDVDGATFTVSGNASVTFGVDLMSMATGFTNASAADFVLNFAVPTTALKSGMDDGAIYGEIAFKDIRAEIEENDIVDANIVLNYAKIMGPDFWLSVVGPDTTIDYENALQNGIIGVAAGWDSQMDNVSNAVASTGGFEFGYTLPDIAAIEVSLFSMTDWTALEADLDKNAYGLKASVALKAVADLTFEAAVNMGFGAGASTTLNDNMGFGAKVGYAIAAGDITITPEVGLDVKMLDGGGMNMAIGNGLRVAMAGAEVTGAEDGVKDDAGVSYAWDDGVNSGLTLGWDYYMPSVGDAALGLQAHYGLSSIENLQIALGFEIDDVMSDAKDMGFAVWGKYTMGNIAPYAGLFMLLDNETNGGSDGSMIANAGVTFTNLFPLTTLTVAWNSGQLSADDTGDEADLGIVKITVKIAY
jgi:hypothetical protein